jgi:succinate dehydrogenase/fumarate reductase-like Fe-S protein
MGKSFQVPSALTVMKAMEYAGFQVIRGCGCRGGVCGACATVYRVPGDNQLQTGLACVTLVQDGMMLFNIPYFPTVKPKYDLETLRPTNKCILKIFPEINKCMGCNTCTKTCPQSVPVMEVVSAALQGDVQSAAELSPQCVMCGLCAARCPAGLSPYHIALLCRRLYGRYILPPYPHVIARLEQLDRGEYNNTMKEIMGWDYARLREEYNKTQADKKVI